MKHRLYIAAAFLLCAALVTAQEYRATLVGTVTDQSGAAVPGTRLTVTNIETGVSVNAVANDQGRYVAPYMLPGPVSGASGAIRLQDIRAQPDRVEDQ